MNLALYWEGTVNHASAEDTVIFTSTTLDEFLTSPNLCFLTCKTGLPYRVIRGMKQNDPCKVLVKIPSLNIQKNNSYYYCRNWQSF